MMKEILHPKQFLAFCMNSDYKGSQKIQIEKQAHDVPTERVLLNVYSTTYP